MRANLATADAPGEPIEGVDVVKRRILWAMTAALVLLPVPALAHPHVYVDSHTEFVFDAEGKLTALRHDWIFDEGFSSFASQGLDTDNDGKLSREELQPLAKINVESLLEYGYFTIPRVDGKKVGFKVPSDYYLTYAKGELTLHFTLPLREAVDPVGHKIEVDVYDPGYFVDFELMKDKPATVTGLDGCSVAVKRKPDPDDATAALLGSIPASERALPRSLQKLTETLANRLTLDCK